MVKNSNTIPPPALLGPRNTCCVSLLCLVAMWWTSEVACSCQWHHFYPRHTDCLRSGTKLTENTIKQHLNSLGSNIPAPPKKKTTTKNKPQQYLDSTLVPTQTFLSPLTEHQRRNQGRSWTPACLSPAACSKIGALNHISINVPSNSTQGVSPPPWHEGMTLNSNWT